MNEDERIGLATRLPGLLSAKKLLEREIADVEHRLALAQNGNDSARAFMKERHGERKPGRPPKATALAFDRKSKAVSGYWGRMTPDERSAEMARRVAIHQGKAPSSKMAAAVDVERLHPRDKRSPRHAAWIKKMRKTAQKTWATMTDVQRVDRLTRMGAAKQLNGAAQ